MERPSHVAGADRRPKLDRFVRASALIVLDAAAWTIGLTVAAVVRYEFEYAVVDTGGLARTTLIAVLAQVAWGFAAGLYPGRRRLGSFGEAGVVGGGGLVIGAALFVWVGLTHGARPVPLSVTVAGPALFILGALGARFLARFTREVRSVSRHERRKRTLFFGAGEAGHEVTAALRRDPETDILPVAFLDDDPSKRRLRVYGSPVVGGRSHIAEAARQHHADTLVIAMPSASRSTIAFLAREARDAGLQVLIVPSVARFLDPSALATSIRPLRFEDFLGRDPVRLDMTQMAAFVAERKVLITGAGGSIGSELAAAVTRLGPASLHMLDRDENALHATQLRLEGRALLDTDRLVVADIRDARRMHEVFEHCAPDIVFHAAALKHVTFLERYPAEAVKTNVLGTANVLETAALYGVKRFVNISTDKAADPVNVLGFTKRIGEMLTAGQSSSGMTALSVRFGNVLGSNGSVVPTFRDQILRGGPITVTHRDVTRFFMTIEEAAHLVIQAGAIGRKGEVLVLEMGNPVRIVDLARDLIAELDPGADIEIEYTGLRPGEKLQEVLVCADDRFTGYPHQGISSYAVPPLDATVVEEIETDDPIALRSRLEWIVASSTRRVPAFDELD